MFRLKDYNYDLQEKLIAQVPASGRDSSRLLVVERFKESLTDNHFLDLPGLLKPGDLLVVNNTRVVPARLFGRKESGGQIEILVLEHQDPDVPESNSRWCLLKASERPKEGIRLFFERDISGQVEAFGEGGLTKISFQGSQSIDNVLEENGCIPLPPYIKRDNNDGRTAMDRERYQTVYSSKKGAVAAPTAGLHFTEDLIKKLSQTGISLVELTLHVGHGTFQPVRSEDIREHKLGEEIYIIEPDTADSINRAKKEGRRVIAVGTTVVRTLETIARSQNKIVSGRGRTDLLITPGFKFKVVDGLITNFHLPKSSLLFLVSAFAGLDLIKRAYSRAMENEYRFYSYGDAMLIV